MKQTKRQATVLFSFLPKVFFMLFIVGCSDEPPPLPFYTVTFDIKGDVSVDSQNIVQGQQAETPEEPNRIGYTFEGWFTDENYISQFDFTTPITKSITLYAKWGNTFDKQVETYTSSHFLGIAVKDEFLPENSVIITVSQLSSGAYNWVFGKMKGTKTVANNNGNFVLRKSDLTQLGDLVDGDSTVFYIERQGDKSDEISILYKPYEIRTWKDLQAIRQDLTGDYVLMNDITFPNKGDEGFSMQGFEPIGTTRIAFNGSLDGNDKRINNFSIDRSGDSYLGLFGHAQNLSSDANNSKEIKNFTIAHSGLTGSGIMGTLAGSMTNMIVRNVHVEATASTHLIQGSADNVAGLVGRFTQGTIIQVSVSSKVSSSGTTNIAGLIGTVSTDSRVVGYASGEVEAPNANRVGGLIGTVENNSTISGYATGDVMGNNRVGGLVGRLASTSTVYGYATGNVEGVDSFVGGLVGYNATGNVYGYATGTVRGSNASGSTGFTGVGGLLGYNSGIAVGYVRGNVIRTSGSNRSYGLFVGTITGSSANTGYSSGKDDESILQELSGTMLVDFNGQHNGIDGISVTISAGTTIQDLFSNFVFGTDVGQWTAADGQWPSINLPPEVGGNYLAENQPVAP